MSATQQALDGKGVELPDISQDLSRRFTYHPPKGNQAERYSFIRDRALSLALILDHECPASREKSLALTKLEEAVMWANASIARNE